MRRLLKKPAVVATLGLIAMLLVVCQLWPTIAPRFTRSPGTDAADSAADPAIADAPSGAGAVTAALLSLPSPAGIRDPFASRGPAHPAESRPQAKATRDTFHLSALWTEHDATLAVINGRICQPGDAIGRVHLASASQDGVWITHGSARDFIPLGGDFTLRSAAAPVPPVLTLN
jgi:hypothetical protein